MPAPKVRHWPLAVWDWPNIHWSPVDCRWARRRPRRARRLISAGHGVQGIRRVIGVGSGAQRIIGDVIRATLLPASQRSLNASHTTALARRLYW